MDEAIVTLDGMGVALPRMIGGRFTTPLAGTTKKADSPEMVMPSWTHVALAFTGPTLARTLGRTHEPAALTGNDVLLHARGVPMAVNRFCKLALIQAKLT